MRLLDKLFRRDRSKKTPDRPLEAAIRDDQWLEEQERRVREQRYTEDYPSRGGGWVGR
jgi:hypothetical protein